MGDHRRRRRRRLAVVSVLGLPGLASVLGVILVSLPPPEVRRRLPDGTDLTLEGVTFGETTFQHLEEGGLTELTLPRLRVVEFTARPSA